LTASVLPDAIDPSQLQRVLVIKLRHHGDVLLTSPVFQVLKNHCPTVELDALVYEDTAPMLAGHPAIHTLHTINRQWKKQGLLAQTRAEWHLLRQLRARRYDLIIHLTNHKRGAWLTRCLRPHWAVAPFTGPSTNSYYWKKTFSHHFHWMHGNRRHTVEQHLDALRRIGLQPGPDERHLVFLPGSAARSRVDTLLADAGLAWGRYLLVHPTSRWLFKCWPEASVAELINTLGTAGWPIVLSAAPNAEEMAWIARIKQQLKIEVVDFSGQLSLKELGALIESARLFIGMDSVPMHLAAALDIPSVALFGPSGEIEWGPWSQSARVLHSNHSCRPCQRDGCGSGKLSECLTSIQVQTVLDAVQQQLYQYPGWSPA
jgi:heptosyltransferase III